MSFTTTFEACNFSCWLPRLLSVVRFGGVGILLWGCDAILAWRRLSPRLQWIQAWKRTHEELGDMKLGAQVKRSMCLQVWSRAPSPHAPSKTLKCASQDLTHLSTLQTLDAKSRPRRQLSRSNGERSPFVQGVRAHVPFP